MSTFKQLCLEYLGDRGMFPEQAAAVFEAMAADETNQPMRDRYNEDTNGYPPMIKGLVVMSLRHHAREWIEKNAPLAWYKGLFEDEPK